MPGCTPVGTGAQLAGYALPQVTCQPVFPGRFFMFSGSIVALVTPMLADGSVDFRRLEELVDWHADSGTDGLVIAGTTGESATLGKVEHVEVIRVAAERARGRLPVIAGTGSNSTSQTLELSVAVGSLPVDGYLLVTPYYNKPTQEGLRQHFLAVAEAVDRPVILYNVPGRTGVDLKPETVALLATHPRIVGIKEATGDLQRLAPLVRDCGSDFILLSGDDATTREFILGGGHGVISVTANVAPQAMADMCEAALEGDAALAAQIDEGLAGLHRDLFIESNPIPVKWAMETLGRIGPGIRLPLTRLSAAAQPAVRAAMIQAGVLA
jgi:4-hydroxy-tetrahydrodipicolinate synthase